MIRQCKTYQLRKGNEHFTSRTANSIYPAHAGKLLKNGDIQDYFLEESLVENMGRGLDLQRIVYARWCELLRSKLVQLGHSPDSFGLHNLCASGATVANAGISDRLLKGMGSGGQRELRMGCF